ncbi:MAG: hypothetical protein WCF14_10585 [Nitrososphaeraceae archaeon]
MLTRSADLILSLLDTTEKKPDKKSRKQHQLLSLVTASNISIIVNTQAKYLVSNNPIPRMHGPSPVKERYEAIDVMIPFVN